MKSWLMAAGCVAAFAASGSARAATNLITNGGFELTNNGYSETDTPVGWTNIGHTDGVIAYSVFNTPAYDGSYYYDEGGYGDAANGPGDGIEQTVATVAGQQYTLTFGLSQENESGTEIADVTIGSQETQYTLTPTSNYGEFQLPFTTYQISYTADSPTTTIAFTTDAPAPSLGDNDPLIDGISFSGPSVSSAPEPSTWALMIAGVGLAGAALRLGRRSGSPATA